MAVVQDGELDGQLVGGDGDQVLKRHLEATVAADRPHQLVRTRHLRPDGGWHLEAHGAQSAGGDERVRLVEPEELGRPHLVLPHAGDHCAVAFRRVVDGLDHVLGQQLIGLPYGDGRMLLP
jgi:hypothetical protein